MTTLRAFFESRSADRLMDPATRPAAIDGFLKEEIRLLETIASTFDRLVEVGCMQGRHLDWTIGHGKRYVGIDIVERHLEIGRRIARARGLATDACRFLRGDAEEIDRLLGPPAAGEKSLIFFPFNVFGAVGDVRRVMAAVRRSERPFLISAYQVTDDATARREEYYRRSGCRDLCVRQDAHGVCFETADGFRTIAYDPAYLVSLWREHGVEVSALVWSRLNAAYVPASLLADARPAEAASGGCNFMGSGADSSAP